MGVFDENLEKRVWDRVHGSSQPSSLQTLAAAEQGCAAVYLRLARMTQGPSKTVLRQLYAHERSHSRCLNGISIAAQGKPLSVRTAPPPADSMTVALRKCYAQTLRAMDEYRQRSEDREYGHIFAHMAEQEKANSRMILELLGTEPRG